MIPRANTISIKPTLKWPTEIENKGLKGMIGIRRYKLIRGLIKSSIKKMVPPSSKTVSSGGRQAITRPRKVRAIINSI